MLRKLRLFSVEERCLRGDLINGHKYVMGGSDEDGSRLFSLEPIYRTRDSVHKLKHKEFNLNKLNQLCCLWFLFCFAMRVIKYKRDTFTENLPRMPLREQGNWTR